MIYDDVKCNSDITPKKDIVFKRIFGSKGNEAILKDLLESILDKKIESLSLDLSTELLPEFYAGKKSRVDVRSRLSDGTEVNIEMQINPYEYSDKRCLQHWSKLYSNTLIEGNKYTDLKKTICIWIINGEVFKDIEEFHSKWEILNKKAPNSKHFKELEIHIIELQKFRKLDIMKPMKKDFWLWFIDHTNEEMINLSCVTNEQIEEARKQLDKIRANEELMERIRLEEAYEMDENTRLANAEERGMKIGEERGKTEGMKIGEEQNKLETAKKMLAKNMDINLISELTDLSIDEIKKLSKE